MKIHGFPLVCVSWERLSSAGIRKARKNTWYPWIGTKEGVKKHVKIRGFPLVCVSWERLSRAEYMHIDMGFPLSLCLGIGLPEEIICIFTRVSPCWRVLGEACQSRSYAYLHGFPLVCVSEVRKNTRCPWIDTKEGVEKHVKLHGFPLVCVSWERLSRADCMHICMGFPLSLCLGIGLPEEVICIFTRVSLDWYQGGC